MVDQGIYQAERVESAKRDRTNEVAPLRLGESSVVGLLLLLDCLKGLSLSSSVPIEIESTDSSSLLDKLREGSIEVAVVGITTEEDALEFHEIGREEEVLAVPPGHRLSGKTVISFEELHSTLTDPSEVFIRRRQGGTRDVHQRLFEELGATVPDKLLITSVEGAKQSIVKRLGISILPRLALRLELETGAIKALQIGETGRYRPFYVAARNGHALSPGAEEFMRIATGSNRKEKAATRG